MSQKERGFEMLEEVSKVVTAYAAQQHANPSAIAELIPKVYEEFKKIFNDVQKTMPIR